MLPLAFLLMAGVARVNPKEIEEILHVMNSTQVEFVLPDKDDDTGGRQPPGAVGG